MSVVSASKHFDAHVPTMRIEPDIEIMGVISGGIVPHDKFLQRGVVGSGHRFSQAFLYSGC
ncbi:hypothetical protein D3C80_2152230 [compost metagenome]